MRHYAHLVDGVVAELLPETVDVAGRALPLDERFHPDFVSGLIEAPPEVQPGWRREGGAWLQPAAPEEG